MLPEPPLSPHQAQLNSPSPADARRSPGAGSKPPARCCPPATLHRLARATRPSLRSAWPSLPPPHQPHLASCPRSRFARARELVGPTGCASPGPRDASCNVADFIYNKDLEN